MDRNVGIRQGRGYLNFLLSGFEGGVASTYINDFFFSVATSSLVKEAVFRPSEIIGAWDNVREMEGVNGVPPTIASSTESLDSDHEREKERAGPVAHKGLAFKSCGRRSSRLRQGTSRSAHAHFGLRFKQLRPTA